MSAVTRRLRGWYLIALSLVPPLWSITDWRTYAHIADPASAASYLALALSPVLFVLGTRRLFRVPEHDSTPAP
jgi:hypothetical protein